MNGKKYTLNGAASSRRLTVFTFIKYVTLIFALLLLLGAIIVMPLGPNAVDNVLDDEKTTPESIEGVKAAWYWAAALTLVVSGLGVFGIFREQFCLTTLYSLYLLVSLFGSIFASTVWKSSPYSLIFLAIITGWSLIYSFLLLRLTKEDEFDEPPTYIP